jgi:hypothetical protein
LFIPKHQSTEVAGRKYLGEEPGEVGLGPGGREQRESEEGQAAVEGDGEAGGVGEGRSRPAREGDRRSASWDPSLASWPDPSPAPMAGFGRDIGFVAASPVAGRRWGRGVERRGAGGGYGGDTGWLPWTAREMSGVEKDASLQGEREKEGGDRLAAGTGSRYFYGGGLSIFLLQR